MLGSAVFVLLSWFLFFFVNPFFFRSKLLIILFLFLQSFCFIVNRLTSEPFFFHYLMMHLFCDIFREECFWLGSFSVVGFIYAFISKFFLFLFVMEGVGLNWVFEQCILLYESPRRKPGWRFTAGCHSRFSLSGNDFKSKFECIKHFQISISNP